MMSSIHENVRFEVRYGKTITKLIAFTEGLNIMEVEVLPTTLKTKLGHNCIIEMNMSMLTEYKTYII